MAHFFLQRRFRCVAKADNGRRNFGTLDSGPFMGVDLHLSRILTFGFQEGVTSTKLVSRSNFIVGQQAKHVEHSWVAGSQESGIGVIAPKLDRDAPSQIAAVLAGPSVAKSPPAPARFGTSTVLSLRFGWASAPEIVDGSSRSSSAVKEHNNSASTQAPELPPKLHSSPAWIFSSGMRMQPLWPGTLPPFRQAAEHPLIGRYPRLKARNGCRW
ncbi:hypothetical protein X797_002185 [Metarhizium robertsii]|uniref:Uncharacterized protein n=1 Tax=Metarhizium robertsii TaxID=568076 RepID=A0A0A1V2X6_9HYPO|nr:hypothetical protein X797_002185 [Metarhizium robertsii]